MWIKLTRDKLQLFDGPNEQDSVETEKIDSDTLALDVPLDWLRAENPPTQMIISLDIPVDGDE
ncbi:MAG: hypothetical protein AAGD25_19145 [Cyanobacteria bacterium P01_F01_bin.150]